MSVERIDCLRMNKPEWFQRKDFQRFIKSGYQRHNLATWWRPHKPFDDDYCDVFLTFDQEEGSDAAGIPGDIWEAICGMAREAGVTYAVVWIVNNQA